MKFIVQPSNTLKGEVSVPGDKSISHRAAILGSISKGITEISNFLQAEDCLHTMSVLKQLGTNISEDNGKYYIHGAGLRGFKKPDSPLYFGNSGTGIRLMCGLLSGQSFPTVLQGDASLNKRPMQRIAKPLAQMGAHITGRQNGNELFPPLSIMPIQSLEGIRYELPIPSAQIKSCLLLAGLLAKTPTFITEPRPSRDHTERMLAYFGADIRIIDGSISLHPSYLTAQKVQVPNDISSAAFFIVGAAMKQGSQVTLKKVGLNPRRMGVIHILREMGANIEIKTQTTSPEPIGDITVTGSALKGITVPKKYVVDAIDEFPVLFVAASCANGRTIFQGLDELKVKESDRIESMSIGLKKLGVKLEVLPDGVIIDGSKISGGEVESQGDHRVAMAFAIAGLFTQKGITINNCDPVMTSFPNFKDLASQLGLQIAKK